MHLIEKYFFKDRREALIIRFWKIVLKYRTSYPYISGDAFANLCEYAAYGRDGSKPINLRRLRRAKTLFVSSHKLNELLEQHFDDISATVLICGNSDQNFDADPSLPKSVKLWLCQNYAVENGFGRLLPIGIENLRLGKSGFKRFYKLKKKKTRTDKIVIPPMRMTNPIRNQVVEMCRRFPDNFDVVEEYLSTSRYFDLLGESKFVLVLEGNGFDTHRLWECLYLNCIPIVLKSEWSNKLSTELELPIIIIPDTESLINFNLNDQAQNRFLYSENIPKKNLFMPEWENYIESILRI